MKKYSLTKLTLHQWLLASCAFSIVLLMTRVVVTGYITYAFLVWNLFLAFIPYSISNWVQANFSKVNNKWKLATAIVAWILFIPNSFYILTDLFHLDEITSAPKWFDLLLLLSFAWNGLLFGIISLRRIESIFSKFAGGSFSLAFVFFIMLLNAYGIYIGRFLRYNSWDVVVQPFSLFSDLLQMMVHPFQNISEWGMIFCYTVFMTLLYITVKKLAENFQKSNK